MQCYNGKISRNLYVTVALKSEHSSSYNILYFAHTLVLKQNIKYFMNWNLQHPVTNKNSEL